jgi:hypothetical protein
MKYEALMRAAPDAAEVERRASRARLAALARLDRSAVVPGWSRWRPAVAAGLLSLAAAALMLRTPDSPPVPAQSASQEAVRLQMVLSDGTRVQWTFHDDFKL